MNKGNTGAPERDLSNLYLAKMEAIRNGDLDALHVINDRIFLARLDPADPEYESRLEWHRRNVHLRKAEAKAKKVIAATGKPLSFDDKVVAIDEAIDQAVDAFDRAPCPKHAASLLGLIDCWSMLYDANTTESEEPVLGEDGEHVD